MKTGPLKTSHEGSVLVLSVIALAVVAGLVGIVSSLTMGARNTIDRGNKYAQAQAAAEGALEYAYGVWLQEITNNKGPVNTATLNSRLTTPPSFNGIGYKTALRIDAVNEYGVPVSNATGISMDSRQFPGWRAYAYNYVASVTTSVAVRGNQTVDFALKRTFTYSNIPVFGAMFFFEGDFELFMPATMIVNGNVHTNARGYVSTHYTSASDKLRFMADSRVSYVGDYYGNAEPPFAHTWSGYSSNRNGQPIYDLGFANQVKQSEYMQALGTGSAEEFDDTDANPNNDGTRELIEPPDPNYIDPPAIAASRLYNKAGVIVEITGPLGSDSVRASNGQFVADNLRIKPQNGTVMTAAQAQNIRNAITNSREEVVTVPRTVQQEVQVTVDNWVYERVRINKKWQWVWNNYPITTTEIQTVTVYDEITQYVPTSIYDRREGKDVDVSTLNLGTARTTLEGLNDFNGVLYMHDTSSTGSNDPKAIRIANGGVAPSDGLTLASENGVYIQGDLNTGTTTNPNSVPSNDSGNPNNTDSPEVSDYNRAPVAVAGDMIAILSNNWNDNNSSSALSSRVASNTTINAAIISGFLPGGWTNENGVQYGYSGGANNFPRFLETWSGKYLTYFGSMVQLYTSKQFTGRWETGEIYSPPNRCWNFEALFESLSPPGRVNVTSFSRGTWQRGG